MDPILDVTIGLVFLYLLLALMVSIVTDALSGFLRLRSRNLNKSLEALLKSNDGDALSQIFHSTGTMQTIRLMSGQYWFQFWTASRERYTRVESESFVNALLEAGKANMTSGTTKSAEADGEGKPMPALISNAADVIEIIEALPESNIKHAILTVIDDANCDANTLKIKIADWFDTMMETAALRFKAAMKVYAFWAALFVVVLANADTLTIANALWEDDTMRVQIAENAAAFVADADTVDELADFEILQAELRPFPIGWDTASPHHSSDWYLSTDGWAKKMIGWLLTALAVSLGAPFWFDLLKKLAAIRKPTAAASKPADTKPETA